MNIHQNDFSNKQQLYIFTGIVILMFLILIIYINYRPKIRELEQLPENLVAMKTDIAGIYGLVKVLAKNDSLQQSQLSHFPTTPLKLEDMTKVSSTYNIRQDPKTGLREFHTGIDYRAKRGTIVYAAATGIVVEAKWDGGYGNTVRIDHENGYITTYAHLLNMTVIPGEFIQKGDTVGNVGNTGYTTGNHLHYEIAYNNKKINPKYFTQTVQ